MKTEVPDQIRLLALIQRGGTLAAAADELGVSAPAVTQRLSRAEHDWGTPLVVRTVRGATLTPAGAVLASFGAAVDRSARAAEAAFAEYLGVASRRLRVGAFQAAALHLLPPALTALRHRHPDADLSVVDVTSDRAVQAVGAGDLDVAVHATWSAPAATAPGVTTEHLLRDPLVVVMPDDHPLAGTGSPVALRSLRSETWVLIKAGHLARQQFDAAARGAGFSPKVRFETESYDVAQALVGAGIGVALVSRLALTDAPGTAVRPLKGPALHREIHVSTAAESAASLTGPFVDLLRQVARERSVP